MFIHFGLYADALYPDALYTFELPLVLLHFLAKLFFSLRQLHVCPQVRHAVLLKTGYRLQIRHSRIVAAAYFIYASMGFSLDFFNTVS